jgi:hypothetical protein
MSIFDGAKPEFEDFTYLSGAVRCKIRFSKYGWRFRKAQEWLEKSFVDRMVTFMPRKTGALINRTIQVNARSYSDGHVETYGLDYGKKLYSGINPATGKPWHWTNPSTRPYWGEYVIRTYGQELSQGVKDIILRGDTKNAR